LKPSRDHIVVDWPTTSLLRPSGWSRSFVVASLRALHLDIEIVTDAVTVTTADPQSVPTPGTPSRRRER
jgi:hypothetical protein